MDRKSWLWRRKSSEKSPGETESLGSASSHPDRFFDDQEPNSNSPINTSPKHAETPESEEHETVKGLTEKLSTALLSISAKEDLVKQHSKVAEEAVSGWEKAETEVAILKQQLEATAQKNGALEDRINHLDGALKECVWQLRQSRDEQEQKVQYVVDNKTQEWESNKSELESQLAQLKTQLEASKAIEKENADLKAELFLQSEKLKLQTVERELSIQKAESASKQHLESIKKVVKLEAECRKLRSIERKKLSTNVISTSACVKVKSLTDSQSDNGGQLFGVDNEPSCSNSLASALIVKLDQFKNDKSGSKFPTTSVDIDLMDDFLEMERLAALDEADHGRETIRESSLKVEKIESEKAKLEMVLVDAQNQLEESCSQLKIAEGKLVQLQKELDLAYESKQAAVVQEENVEAKRNFLESQLESTLLEVGELQNKVASLEGKVEESREIEAQLQLAHMEVEKLNKNVGLLEVRVEEERALSKEFAAKIETVESELQEKVNLLEQRIEYERSLCREFAAKVETVEIEKKALKCELELARLEVQKLSNNISVLEEKLEGERALNSQFAVKCQNLEEDLSKKRREDGVRLVSISNGEPTQEKELAVAAEKLAECQKTIASLGNHLKSLTTFDESMVESEKLEQLNVGSPPSTLSGFGSLFSRTRRSRIEN